jgi:hypothetical protein
VFSCRDGVLFLSFFFFLLTGVLQVGGQPIKEGVVDQLREEETEGIFHDALKRIFKMKIGEN